MYMIERDWVTDAALRAVVIVKFWWGPQYISQRYKYKKYRCGYVGVPPLHPLYGVHYYRNVLYTLEDIQIKESPQSKNLDEVCDVHGGLTYSGSGSYPVPSDEWWFGFDCAHVGDGYIEIPPGERDILSDGIPKSLEFCISECERLARQLKEIGEGRLTLATGGEL